MKKYIFLLLIVSVFNCTIQAQTIVESVSVEETKEILKDTSVQILDVRTASEIANGKIDNAIEIDYYSDDFKMKLDELNKNKPVLVYCKSGGRSIKASKMLEKKGFKTIYNLKEGYDGWQDE